MTSFGIAIILGLLLVRCSHGLTYSIVEEQAVNTFVGNIKADGIQIPPNNAGSENITFRILQSNSSNMFRIDSTSGKLYTTKILDREIICPHHTADCILNLGVAANDFIGVFFKLYDIYVHIIDINDNAPIFPQHSINLDILEDSLLGTRIQVPRAVDQDGGVLGVKSYKVINTHDCPFNLYVHASFDSNHDLYLVLVKTLDRELRDFYLCIIMAEDGGVPVRSGVLKVNITVLDINDNSPMFSQNIYNITVDAGTQIGFHVVTVSAADQDAGRNGEVSYKLRPLQNQTILDTFDIDRITGALTIVSSLNNENDKTFRIVIEASDQGTPKLTSKAVVLLDVKGSKNNTISSLNITITGISRPLLVNERAPVGSVISLVEVHDPSNRDTSVICISRSGTFKVVLLSNNEFKVVLAKYLDYEMQQHYSLTIACHRRATPQLETLKNVLIEVADVNDNPPIFSHSIYNVSVMENAPVGTDILRLEAFDADSGKNSEIQYNLLTDHYSPFRIDSISGLITLSSVLYRESTSIFELRAVAIDHGNPQFTGSAKVVVTVKDINLHAPQFTSNDLHFHVPENVPASTLVGVARATDVDAGDNGKIVFAAPSQFTAPFSISKDGGIYTKMVLDRELSSTYVFNIIAKDNGIPPLKTVARVTVDVKDVNDNIPVFVYPQSPHDTVTVTCDLQSNITIATARAFDADLGKNGEVRYNFQDQTQTLFLIDSVSGHLTAARHLSASDVGRHSLIIQAKDCGSPSLQSKQNIDIVVQFMKSGQSCAADEIFG